MDIRIATAEDVPALVALSRLEHGQSRFRDRPFDAAVAARNFEQAIAGMLTKVFISQGQGGFIGGALQPALFNKFFTAYELCWYAQDGSGLALLDAFCEWARKMRAIELVLSNYAGIKADVTFTRVMRRKGFHVLGTTYCKNLEN